MQQRLSKYFGLSKKRKVTRTGISERLHVRDVECGFGKMSKARAELGRNDIKRKGSGPLEESRMLHSFLDWEPPWRWFDVGGLRRPAADRYQYHGDLGVPYVPCEGQYSENGRPSESAAMKPFASGDARRAS